MGPVLPLVALGVGLIGTAGQVISGLGAAESEAGQFETVAQFQDIEARSIVDTAAAEEEMDRRRTARALGRLRAVGAATGVDPGAGSLLLLELDSAKEAELSALTIRQRGQLGAFEKRVGAQLSRRQAAIARGRKGGIIAKGIFQGASLLAGFAGRGGGGDGRGGTTPSVFSRTGGISPRAVGGLE